MKAGIQTFLTPEKKIPLLALLTGTLVAYAITCIFFILCALLLRFTPMTEDTVPLIVTISCVVSVAFSGFDAAKAAESQGWLWGLIAGAIYAVILLCIGAWAIQGYRVDLRGVTLIALCVAGGGLGGIFGINFKKKKK